MLNANVLDFRYIFALRRTTALIICDLALKMVQILGFSVPVRFRNLGAFEEIGIAKVLLNTKPRRVGKFRGCRFSHVWESVAREKKKINSSQNIMVASLSLR